jgi:hypothetical protein
VFVEVWVVAWLIAAVVGTSIGNAKGRPAANAIWGLLLGPIGWLVILIAPDVRPKCPDCGGSIVANARKCKNYGTLLVNDAPATLGLARDPQELARVFVSANCATSTAAS